MLERCTEHGGGDSNIQQPTGVVADTRGAVEVDSDAMGSVLVCRMHTTINRRVRYITINHGVRIQHQPWVSIINILKYNQQRTCDHFRGKGSRIRT